MWVVAAAVAWGAFVAQTAAPGSDVTHILDFTRIHGHGPARTTVLPLGDSITFGCGDSQSTHILFMFLSRVVSSEVVTPPLRYLVPPSSAASSHHAPVPCAVW